MRSTPTPSKWEPPSAPRSPIAWRRDIGGMSDEVTVRECRGLRRRLNSSRQAIRTALRSPSQDAASRDPRWVPAISSVSSASIGAHISTHGAFEAARVIFRFGLWPAALELWGIRQKRPAGRAMGQRTMAGSQAGDARSGAVGFRDARGEGARARRRHRRDGPWLQSLGMVARILHDGGRDLECRYRCACRTRRLRRFAVSIGPR